MCFSATASFASAAALVSVGAYCVTIARKLPKYYLAIAVIPLLFGVQQFIEGMVWQQLELIDPLRTAALGYLFFSHFFWLLWIPLICYLFETDTARKDLFFVLLLLGSLFGLSMLVPLLLNPDWLVVVQIRHSISYETVLIYDNYIPRGMVRAVYALVVMPPLLLSSDVSLRKLGYMVAISVLVAVVFYSYAFISVWCFFAALLSVYFAFIVLSQPIESNVRVEE